MANSSPTVVTRLTKLLGIKHPIMSAGMATVAGPRLVAAVSNAGGIGTLGAIGLTPAGLRTTIQKTRALLHEPSLPIGVDLLLPKLGDGARKTNHDYTGGHLNQLIDVIIEEKVKLFVCAVGVPPRHVVDRLHANGIYVMNMIGSPRHVRKCLEAGVDIICPQGTEGGGHTGDITTMVLLPQVVDLCAGTGVIVVGAGGISDGRGMSACIALGAEGVWIGSRFLMTAEANVPADYQQAVVAASSDQTVRTCIFTGRPARGIINDYVKSWHSDQNRLEKTLAKGIVPFVADLMEGKLSAKAAGIISLKASGDEPIKDVTSTPFDKDKSFVAIGQCVGALSGTPTVEEVVNDIMKTFSDTVTKLCTIKQSRL